MTQTDIRAFINGKLASGTAVITEADAKKIFEAHQIPVVEGKRASSIKKAGEAAREIGFPVVLKGIGTTLLHKSESNMVRLGLASQAEVGSAAMEMANLAGDALEEFLVQPVIRGRREFVAGMFKDHQFGPVIMFGLGGIFTEAFQDIVFKIAPLSEADMDDMMARLISKKLLGAFRGEALVDRGAVKAILKGLSDLAMEQPGIKEMDLNPILIQEDGTPVAVDGLIILEEIQQTESRQPRIDLEALGASFYPRSIAFVGASASPGKWGHLLSSNTLSRHYKGVVSLVNPKGGTIMGRKVYTSITEVPGPVDLAVVTIPAGKVMALVAELQQKKVKAMLLITSGFREVGVQGAAMEKELVKAAQKAGILLLGPNTMGLCNPHADFYCSAAHAYPIPGSTTLVCQSGNMGTQLLAFAEQQGIGIRAFSGSGNEAMVTIEDYMEAFEIDDLTRTVVLYIESVKNGKRFFESAKRVSRTKPVVVLKGGRTGLGEKAAASHTGAMASNARVFDTACSQAGIIQVEQPMELLDLSAVFSSLPLPKGNRVAIMTLGGGWGVIATDLCAEYGLEVPALSDDITQRLNAILPEFWSHGNPVDIVGESDPDIPKTCLKELLKWEGCDAVIHLGIHGRRVLINNMIQSMSRSDPSVTKEQARAYAQTFLAFEEDYTRYVANLTQEYHKPVLGVSLLTDALSRTLYRFDNLDYKAVFFPSPERAVKALSGMVRYQSWCRL